MMEKIEINNSLIKKYERELRQNADSRAFAPLAKLYRKLGLYDNAFKVLKDGLRRYPSYLPGYLELALCYYDLKHFHSAYLAVRPFLDTHRDNLSLLRLSAHIFVKLNMMDKAQESYEQLAFLHPRDKEAKEFLHRPKSDKQKVETDTSGEFYFNVDGINCLDPTDTQGWMPLDLKNDKKQEPPPVPPPMALKPPPLPSSVSGNNNTDTHGGIATLTLARLYLKQGHPLKAKNILKKIFHANPLSKGVRRRIRGPGRGKKEKLALFLENIQKKFQKNIYEKRNDAADTMMAVNGP